MDEAKKPSKKFLLDLGIGRYSLVDIVKEWSDVLKTTDEGKKLTPSEIIKQSMDDVLSGRVTEDDIKKAKAKMKSAPAEEAKDEGESEHGKSKKDEKGKK